ncbi:hypothetical protein ACIG54_02250 [Streptomyces achromogenes]|uniref:hypothetical protein n=1 Tax=Streptomyces achromogenes TaxID=67255 RepID=UPI0037D14618
MIGGRDDLLTGACVFVGVTDPLDPTVETPGQVCDRVLAAARVKGTALAATALDFRLREEHARGWP